MVAPDFSLPDQFGNIHTLKQYRGKWVVIYFYPKDDTPGCTKEACGFRDLAAEYKKKHVTILGISKDTVVSHKKFAEKFHLSFPLLSDPNHVTIEAFGAWGVKKFMGREFSGILRNSYLIDPKGTIAKKYERVNPLTHPAQILQDVINV